MADEKQVAPEMEKEAITSESTRHTSDKVILHANDADEAMKAFVSSEGEVLVLDEATSKRLLRKIDLHLMPVRKPLSWHRATEAERLIAALCHLWS